MSRLVLSPAILYGFLGAGLIAGWPLALLSEGQNAAELLPRPSIQSPQFKADADGVVVDVYVTARDGVPLRDLSADDFRILDDNRPQEVAFVSTPTRAPLAVVLLIDRSSSMAGSQLRAAEGAARAFLKTLQPEDLVEVMAFNDRATRLLSFGSRDAAAGHPIGALPASGRTGLFDAVLVGLQDIERALGTDRTVYRHALVILSDGEDTSSLVSFDDVLENVRRSGTLIYGISLRTDPRGRSLPPPHELSQFANDSGGKALAVGRTTDLLPIYEEIGAELRDLYQVGFVPAPSIHDGRWHSVSVRVPGKDAHIRGRAGYYAPRPAAPSDRVRGTGASQ